MYSPKPIDTQTVNLTPEMSELVETLARNTHDVWARRRISGGWKYGSRQDAKQKKHPDLVPYDELSETEKQLDRDTVTEVLKVLVALGYGLKRP